MVWLKALLPMLPLPVDAVNRAEGWRAAPPPPTSFIPPRFLRPCNRYHLMKLQMKCIWHEVKRLFCRGSLLLLNVAAQINRVNTVRRKQCSHTVNVLFFLFFSFDGELFWKHPSWWEIQVQRKHRSSRSRTADFNQLQTEIRYISSQFDLFDSSHLLADKQSNCNWRCTFQRRRVHHIRRGPCI